MLLQLALASALTTALASPGPDSIAAKSLAPIDAPVGAHAAAPADTVRRRAKAVEISDAYATRLTIHRWASYATLPIFGAQAIVGQRLYDAENNGTATHGLRDTHDAIAVALGTLFAVNTVTGALNWWETRHEEKGRAWRTVHAALMLAADAGFAYTAAIGSNGRYDYKARDLHRTAAELSAGTALISYIMMWSPIRRD
jgi:hypothetical protein